MTPILINPSLVKKDYLKDLPFVEKEFFEGLEEGKIIVLALVTIRRGTEEPITMNLMGSLVIDIETRTGRQVILANSGYNCQHPLIFKSE